METFFTKYTKNKRFAAILLAFMMIMQLLASGSVWDAEDSGENTFEPAMPQLTEVLPNDYGMDLAGIAVMAANIPSTGPFENVVDITDSQLFLDGATNELANGETVSYSNSFKLRYTFDITEDQSNAIKALIDTTATPKYEIPLPVELDWDGLSVNAELTVNYSDGSSEKFAELSVESGTAYITFAGDFWNNADPGEINDGWLELWCQLDSNETAGKQSVDIQFITNKTLTLNISDNKLSEHSLTKTVKYADNQFEWTITYAPGQTQVTYPLTLTDTFDNSVHILVPESITQQSGLTVDTVGNTTTLSYEIANAPTSAITLTYKTRLADTQTGTEQSVTIENSATLKDDADQDVTPAAIAQYTVGAEFNRWIYKTGKQYNREIEWTITISSLDRDLKDLILYDYMEPGLALKAGSVQITPNTTFDVVEASGGLDLLPGYDSNGTTFAVKFNNPPYASQYTVTYRTTIDDIYFNDPMLQKPNENSAWLTFDWRKYNPDGTDGDSYTYERIFPVLDNNFGSVTNIIQKRAIKYDPSTRKITWEVTVNPYKVNVQSGTITDSLSDFGQTYADGFSQSGGYFTPTSSTGDGTLTVNINGLGNDTATFQFNAYVTKPEDFAGNKTTQYKNTVEFKGKVNNSENITDSAAASLNITSKMLSKTSQGYSYDANGDIIITWSLTANQNKMQITNAEIVDTLPVGLSYVAGSLTVDGVSSTPTVNGQTLEITLGDPNKEVNIEYKTKVDVSAVADFKTSEKVTFTNSAKLTHGAHTGGVTVSAKQDVSNKILNKNGVFNSADKLIAYTVEINPNKVDLTGMTIRDIPSASLRLDIDSVKLVEAEISSDGKFTAQNGHEHKFDDANSIFTFDGHRFSFELPDGTKSFILTYDCYIVSGTQFNNTIELVSVGGASNSGSANVAVAGGGGGGTSSKKARLTITKEDSMRPGVKLAGVVFEVYQTVNNADILIMSVATDANGKADLYPLTPNKEYVVKEVNSNIGYSVNSIIAESTGNVEVSVVTNAEMNVKVTSTGNHSLTVKNTPSTGGFSFVTKSDKNLQGDYIAVGTGEATFKATDKTKGSTYIVEVSTDANGEVKFEYLPFGKYTISEIVTPPYHTSATAFEVEIGADGTVVLPHTEVLNTFYRPKLTIDMSFVDGTAPSEVELELYEHGGLLLETITANDGTSWTVPFAQPLEGGKSYEVKEKSTPDGYYVSDSHIISTINSNNDLNVQWKNYAYAAEIEIEMTDDVHSAVTLAGAVFELYSDENGSPGTLVATSPPTGVDGKTKFGNLELEQSIPYSIDNEPVLTPTTYWIVAVTAPDGYDENMPSTPIKVDLTTRTQYERIVIANGRLCRDIVFTKVNEWDIPLSGAEFTLASKPGSYPYTANALSGADGVTEFQAVPFGEYTLKEITAPANHDLDTVEYELSIRYDGTITLPNKLEIGKFTNNFHSGSVTITVTDDVTGNPMQGVTFTIKDSNDIERGTAITNEHGVAEFPKLMVDEEYTIHEATPAGYYPCEPYIVQAFTQGHNESIAWSNYPYGASVSVTVVDKANGNPLRGVSFGLYAADGTLIATAVSDSGGNLVFEGLPLAVATSANFNSAPIFGGTIQYTIRELRNISGYLPLYGEITVTLSDSNPDILEQVQKNKAPVPPPSAGGDTSDEDLDEDTEPDDSGDEDEDLDEDTGPDDGGDEDEDLDEDIDPDDSGDEDEDLDEDTGPDDGGDEDEDLDEDTDPDDGGDGNEDEDLDEDTDPDDGGNEDEDLDEDTGPDDSGNEDEDLDEDTGPDDSGNEDEDLDEDTDPDDSGDGDKNDTGVGNSNPYPPYPGGYPGGIIIGNGSYGNAGNSGTGSGTETEDETETNMIPESNSGTSPDPIPDSGSNAELDSLSDDNADHHAITELNGETDLNSVLDAAQDSNSHQENDLLSDIETGSIGNEELQQESQTEITEYIRDVHVIIPEFSTVEEDKIIQQTNVPERYKIVQIDEDIFVIYEGGIPLGYFIMPEDMTLDEFDILGQMIPLAKKNPKTGGADEIPVWQFWPAIAALIALAGIVFVRRKSSFAKR